VTRTKTVFDGEWVKVRPLMNKHFGADADPRCELCGRLSCAVAWYSIKTNRFRCTKCFAPAQAAPCFAPKIQCGLR